MQPLSTNRATVSPPAGADQPFIAARFACLALAIQMLRHFRIDVVENRIHVG